MGGAGFMERLLDGAVIEWKALGDENFFEIANNKRMPVKAFLRSSGVTPYYGANNIQGYIDGYTHDGEYTLIAEDGSASLEKYSIQYVRGKFWANNHVHVVCGRPRVNTKFIYHYLSTVNFIPFLTGGTRAKLTKGKMVEIPIPIPCPENPKKSLEIQTEIVRILDAFTAVTSELTSELTTRNKQYQYYREKLLSFDGKNVVWKTLKEVAIDFGRGKSKHRPRNDPKLYGGDIPLIQTGDIRNAPHVITNYTQTYSEFGLAQSKLWPKGTLCITIAANIAETTILGFDSCFPDSVIGFIANPEKTSSHYVEYLLSSLKAILQSKSTGSAQDNINLATFESLRFPFPPLAEQARIVAILDQFDTLTTSLTEGLPREIALRQQQYEHYRDLLLSFPPPETRHAQLQNHC